MTDRCEPQPPEWRSSHAALNFLRHSCRSFAYTGSLFATGRKAARRISDKVPANAELIYEFGAGTGVMTVELLARLSARGRLCAFEIVEDYAATLDRIPDPRLTVRREDVVSIAGRADSLPRGGVDAVVSGIPFSFLPPVKRHALVRSVHDGLRRGGSFVLYQTSPMMVPPLKKLFDRVTVGFEPRNLPPYFIIVASKG